MIHFMSGNIFESKAQTITNPVNCVGVMGKGLALGFKTRYPAMFMDYAKRCSKNEVKLGEPYVWSNGSVQILNFPTKGHWRDRSYIKDIEVGLDFIVNNYKTMGITSLAIPALGCGLGELSWDAVKALIEEKLGNMADIEIFVFEPNSF